MVNKFAERMNGNLKLVLAIVGLGSIVFAWGVTWSAVRAQVCVNERTLTELKDCKADKEVVTEQFRRLEMKLDLIREMLEKRD